MSHAQTDTYFLAGVLLRFLVRDPEAGYCLVDGLVAPGGGAPPNRHPTDDEAFYVLEGRFEFQVGDETRIAGPGEFVRVPRGAVHAFRNIDPTPSRLLTLNAPGTLHRHFFAEAGDPMPPGTWELPDPVPAPDVARLMEVGRRHGKELFAPQG